ncbi:leucine-rich repeat transmembrane protein kinase protein [Tanacetum coccineum]
MVLTNTPFNGGNLLEWSKNVKMALRAKLKLGFIIGSCLKPAITDENVQRWVRYDYMKEIVERYGHSNGPLIYQLEKELSKIKQECTCAIYDKIIERDSYLKLIQFLMKLNDEYESVRSQILAMDPLPNVNKAYYIVQQIEKQKQVTSYSFDPSAFFANTNNNRQTTSTRREVRQPRVDTSTDQKRSCTNCGQEGHVFEQSHVHSGFEEMISGDTPFDLGTENENVMGQNGNVNQRLVAAVCSYMMKVFKGKGIADDTSGTMRNHASTSTHADPIMVYFPDGRSLKVTIVREVALTPSLILSDVFYDLTTKEIMAVGKGSRCLYIFKPMLDLTSFTASIAEFHESHKLLAPISVFNKTAYSNVVKTNSSLDANLFHASLGHTSTSKLVHIHECKQFDVS